MASGWVLEKDISKIFRPGAVFEDRGFVSTTLAEEVAERFSHTAMHHPVIMEIDVRPGSNAYHIPCKVGQHDEAKSCCRAAPASRWRPSRRSAASTG